MYVAVLNTQKTVLQEDADKLRAQLHEVCRLLEQEKREHTDLKRTWQMANDQFLESQRLMIMDMRRLETVLSAEQQRQITGEAQAFRGSCFTVLNDSIKAWKHKAKVKSLVVCFPCKLWCYCNRLVFVSTELKQKDAERDAQEKRVKELGLMREREQQEQEKRRQTGQ